VGLIRESHPVSIEESVMLIALPLRLPVHVLDFGYLVDAATGEPLRQLGRGTLRVSTSFPESCTAHGLPGRLAGHVSDLRVALEADPERQHALAILPSYSDGTAFAGTHVTIQRVVLDTEFETEDRPGDSTRSTAMVFDWKSFCRLAGNIIGDTARFLEPKPIADQVPSGERLQIGRPTIELRTRGCRRIAELSRAAIAMLSAIVEGDNVRLGERDCPDEPAFLAALADVFEVVPEPLRGHIAAAAGLTLPDPAFQIAWARCLTSTANAEASLERLFGDADPEMPLSEAGSLLFDLPQDLSFRPSGVSAECCYAGELISTRTNAGVMPQIRRFVSSLARSNGSRHTGNTDQSFDCDRALEVMADLLVSAATPAHRRRLVRFMMTASPEETSLVARESGRRGEPAMVTVAQMLAGKARDIDLRGLAATLILARDAQATPDTKRFGATLTLSVRGELTAFLRSKLLFNEPMLRAITSSDEFAGMAAAVFADEEPSLTTRLLDSIAVIELLGPQGQALAAAVRQRLTPRNGHAGRAWRKPASDVGNKARALSLLISAEPLDTRDLAQHASALASHLIQDGRRDIVVDAMRGISTRLNLCKTPGSPVEAIVEQRRLDVLISLASVLRTDSNPADVGRPGVFPAA
jgi:hypothetical protein